MKIIYFLINYLILGWFLFVISYYRDLYNGKENYTRNEVFSYPNIIKDQFRSLFGGMPFTMGMIFFVLASILGGWMPLWGNLFGNNYNNWFFNSAAPFLILYFIIPSIFALDIHQQNFATHKPAKNNDSNDIDNTNDTNESYLTDQSKGIAESFKTLFQDHYNLLAASFGLGYTSYLTFNWGVFQAHPFFWNIANAAVIFWFSLQSMRNANRFFIDKTSKTMDHAAQDEKNEQNNAKKRPKKTDEPDNPSK